MWGPSCCCGGYVCRPIYRSTRIKMSNVKITWFRQLINSLLQTASRLTASCKFVWNTICSRRSETTICSTNHRKSVHIQVRSRISWPQQISPASDRYIHHTGTPWGHLEIDSHQVQAMIPVSGSSHSTTSRQDKQPMRSRRLWIVVTNVRNGFARPLVPGLWKGALLYAPFRTETNSSQRHILPHIYLCSFNEVIFSNAYFCTVSNFILDIICKLTGTWILSCVTLYPDFLLQLFLYRSENILQGYTRFVFVHRMDNFPNFSVFLRWHQRFLANAADVSILADDRTQYGIFDASDHWLVASRIR